MFDPFETSFSFTVAMGVGLSVLISAFQGSLSSTNTKSDPLLEKKLTDRPCDDDPVVEEDEDDDFIPPVRLDTSEDDVQESHVLSPPLMQQVAEQVLPLKLADYQWKRLYSLSRDGDDFSTFLNAVKDAPCTLLVIRTRSGAVLGGFADCPWKTEGPTKYNGGPNARLFRVINNGEEVECFPWTGANMYCQLCDVARQRIAFGGGSSTSGAQQPGTFGLTLERDFLEGTTASCPTFRNPALCEEGRFAVVEMEVYGFKLW